MMWVHLNIPVETRGNSQTTITMNCVVFSISSVVINLQFHYDENVDIKWFCTTLADWANYENIASVREEMVEEIAIEGIFY